MTHDNVLQSHVVFVHNPMTSRRYIPTRMSSSLKPGGLKCHTLKQLAPQAGDVDSEDIDSNKRIFMEVWAYFLLQVLWKAHLDDLSGVGSSEIIVKGRHCQLLMILLRHLDPIIYK